MTRYTELLHYIVAVVDIAKFNTAYKAALGEQEGPLNISNGNARVLRAGRDDAIATHMEIQIQLTPEEKVRMLAEMSAAGLTPATKKREFSYDDNIDRRSIYESEGIKPRRTR
jgi:hypothetical protein